jgi:hypothetical protein
VSLSPSGSLQAILEQGKVDNARLSKQKRLVEDQFQFIRLVNWHPSSSGLPATPYGSQAGLLRKVLSQVGQSKLIKSAGSSGMLFQFSFKVLVLGGKMRLNQPKTQPLVEIG